MPANDPTGGFKVRILKDGVRVLAKQIEQLFPLMDKLGNYLCQVSRAAFQNQSWDGQKWAEKKAGPLTPSIMGSVEDLSKGPEIAASRFAARPALVNTGALRRSFKAMPTAKTVKIVSTMPYAQLQNEGGLNILYVTKAVRQNLAAYLRRMPNLRPHLGFLFNAWQVEATIPARQFIGVPESSRAKIDAMVQEYMQKQADAAKDTSIGE